MATLQHRFAAGLAHFSYTEEKTASRKYRLFVKDSHFYWLGKAGGVRRIDSSVPVSQAIKSWLLENA